MSVLILGVTIAAAAAGGDGDLISGKMIAALSVHAGDGAAVARR